MSDEEYEFRKVKKFAVAEGKVVEVSQLNRDDISPELRALVWNVLYDEIAGHVVHPRMYGDRAPHLDGRWTTILRDLHVYYDNRMIDEFSSDWEPCKEKLKKSLSSGNYLDFYGLIDFVIKHDACPHDLSENIALSLAQSKSPFRVVNGDTLVPIASEAEAKNYAQALEVAAEFPGCKKHLLNAGEFLTQGKWGDSIRESVHAVESIATRLAPDTKALGPALDRLEKEGNLHGALKKGFAALYGFASDEDGIRHALLDIDKANVDETDAQFMMGSCAAFVTYMVNRGRDANILNSDD